MRNRSSRLALAALLGMVALHAQPAPRSAEEKLATVEGEIRDAVTLAPIERAHVVLTRLNGSGERYGALTGADGAFVITKINASGASKAYFEIRVDRIAYVDLTPGSQRMVPLAPGDRKPALKLKLTPTGVITGRVFDSAGVPVEGIAVSAVTGARRQGTTMTDDRGAYRLGGLPPGQYRIFAQQQTLPAPAEIRTDGTSEVHHSPTYHPGELDPKNAARIDVQPAADVAGIDIRLVRTPILRVSGRVIGTMEGGRNAHVVLEAREGGNMGNSGAVRPDGSFEMWRVDPGKYTVRAQDSNGNEQWRSAPVEIEVGGSDLDNIELHLMPPVDIRGTAIFEDEAARKGQEKPAQAPRFFVMLREAGGSSGANSPMDEDGAFVLRNVSPGRYRIVVAPPQLYVKSFEFGQAHFDGADLDLRSGAAATLAVHVASASGVVSGIVRDRDEPAAGLRVMLIEFGARPFNPLTVQSGPDGSYRFAKVPPGKYRILANGEADTMPAPSDEDLEGIADTIEVGDGQTVSKDVKKYSPAGRR